MAEGDLRQPPPLPSGTNEPALIIRDMRVAHDALHSLIRKVRQAARELAGASEEIARASRDLGARTEATAANLEQQASAMEQISTQTRHNSENAQQAAHVSQQNAAVAANGQQVVEAVVGTMHDIQDSSRRITEITNVIDNIAFQTNILALNAAVEAARAGEAGRGFAVVAAEVRSLAQRSAEAAKQIKALIDESVAKVDNGVRVVQQAGNTMSGLVENAQKINALMAEIATAARQQTSGVDQSVQAIQQLDTSTQQNAALVEQTSAAAAALEQQAQRLMEEIASFRL
jgi:methyl-accepting chemotaxis protein